MGINIYSCSLRGNYLRERERGKGKNEKQANEKPIYRRNNSFSSINNMFIHLSSTYIITLQKSINTYIHPTNHIRQLYFRTVDLVVIFISEMLLIIMSH